MKRRTRGRTALRGASLLVVVLVSLAALTGTETGTKGLVALLDGVAGERLDIGESSGTLARGMRLRHLRLDLPMLGMTVAEAEFSWAPAELLGGTVQVDSLRFDDVALDLDRFPPAADEGSLFANAFTPPLGVVAQNVEIRDLELRRAGQVFPVETVRFSAHAGKAGTALTRFTAFGATWQLSAHGRLVHDTPGGVELRASWQDRSGDPRQTGSLNIAGNEEALEFEFQVRSPFDLRSQGRWARGARGHSIQASGEWRDLGWPLFESPMARSDRGRFQIEGALDDIDWEMDCELAADGLPATRLVIAGTASLEPSAALPFEMAGRWQAWTDSDSVLSGEMVASGDREHLFVRPKVSAPFPLRGEVRVDLSDAIQYEAVAEWEGVAWPFTGNAMLMSPEGRLEAQGAPAQMDLSLAAAFVSPDRVREGNIRAAMRLEQAAGLEVSGTLDWEGRLLPQEVPFTGSGTFEGNPSDTLRFSHALTAPFEATTEGVVAFTDGGPKLSVEGAWHDLRWPLDSPHPPYRSAQGRFSMHGPVPSLDVEIDADLGVKDLPPARVRLAGLLDDAGLDLRRGTVDVLGGRLDVHGRMNRLPGVGWDLEIDAQALNPGAHWPQWDGALEGVVFARGEWIDGGARSTFEIETLGGRLRGYPVDARGVVEIAGDQVRAHGLSLRSGGSRLDLEGVYGPEMDVSFSLEAADLGALLPAAAGRLAGEGRIAGNSTSPRVKMRLAGTNIRYRDGEARMLEVDADIAAGETPSRLTLQVQDALAAGWRVDAVSVRAQGRLAEHDARVDIDSDLVSLDMHVSAGMEEGRWHGELRDLSLVTPAAGTWQLAGAANLSVGAKAIGPGRLCLDTEAGGTVCGEFERLDAGPARVEMRDVPLSLMAPWLPARFAVSGRMDADGALNVADGRVEGSLSVGISPGELMFEVGPEGEVSLAHSDTRVEIALDGAGAALELVSTIDGDGRLEAAATLDALNADAALTGALEARLHRLDRLGPAMPELDAMNGRARIVTRVRGSLSSPILSGVARIDVEGARLRGLGIELDQSWVEARVDDERSIGVEGVLHSGGGRLNVEGSGGFDVSPETPFEIALRGDSFEILRLPDANVFASPDLTMRASGESLELEGRVGVPRASLVPRALAASAVKVSSDEVLVDETREHTMRESVPRRATSADVVIELGDEVFFDGYGMTSGLTGELQFVQSPDGVPTGYGELELVDGELRAYGQRLHVESGRLIFAGPLRDPGLDIRAVRKAGAVSAGVRVEGTLSEPRSLVFSEPALPEAEALSYLLTGRSSSSASRNELALLSQAALGLGLESAGLSSMQLQSTLGLDEVSVDAAGDDGDASLVLGKRLTPDISVKYALGLFGRVGTVLLNYRLTEHISLEAESGAAQGLDLLFSLERESLSP